MPKVGQINQRHGIETDGRSDVHLTGLGLDGFTSAEPVQKPQLQAPNKAQLFGPSKANKELDKAARQPRSTPQKNALSFTPCKQSSGQSEVSRKVETLAAAQKIHAQGFLPSFDGSGDSKDPKSNSERDNNNNGSASVNNNSGSKTNTTAANGNSTVNGNSVQDYRRTPRVGPNAMDVRAFFQQLRDEDKEAIRNHRTRPFG